MSASASYLSASRTSNVEVRDGARHVRWMLVVAWGLLILSSLPWRGVQSPIQMTQRAEETGTAVAVAVALLLALCATPRVRFLVIPAFVWAALLAVAAFVPWIYGVAEVGSLERAVRLGAVVAAAWIFAPTASSDGGEPIIEAYLGIFAFLAALIALEAALSPARAFDPTLGRLQGVLPPLPPPRVGEIGAVTAGLAAMAGAYRLIRPRVAVLLFSLGATLLVLSHTRTAVLGLSVGLLVGFAAAVGRSPTARRALIAMTVMVVLAWLVFSSPLATWFVRQQSAEQLASLTGRRDVWELALQRQPSGMALWFGAGLADKSFDGRPIDNGWLAAYVEQGLVGIAIVASTVLAVTWAIWRCRASASRAVAAFLLTFVLVCSVAETGISDASTYLFHVFVAALLVADVARRPDRGLR